jgi:hypothetical protein
MDLRQTEPFPVLELDLIKFRELFPRLACDFGMGNPWFFHKVPTLTLSFPYLN